MYLTMLNAQIPMITTIKPIMSLSTARSSILLFTLQPAKQPLPQMVQMADAKNAIAATRKVIARC